MKLFLLYLFISINIVSFCQTTVPKSEWFNNSYKDSLIRQTLVDLAMKNPSLDQADILINTAELELKRAKSSWLNSITVGGNINEFVVNNTTINGIPASTLFPKYNVGVNIPLGLFGRQETNISKEKIKLYESQKESLKRQLIKEVLVRYENYKEKLDVFELQKQITDGQYSTYQQIQKDFASGEIKDIGDVNKEYELWIEQRSKQRTKDKELRIAELELEEIIGIDLITVLSSLELNK